MKHVLRHAPFITAMALLSAPLVAPATSEDDGFESPIEGRLQSVARNAPQRAIADMVEEICPNGIGRGVIRSQDLQDRCTDVVQAVLVTGDEDGALAAMQALAAEEVDAIGTSEVDASAGQMDAIGTRLQNLRAGGPRVAFAMPGFDGALAAEGGAGLLSGGGASADMASRLGVFINGNYAFNERDATANEAGFDADTYGVTAGVDYQVNEPLMIGAAFTYSNTDADISLRGGTLQTDSYGGFAYASYVIGGGWYVDLMGGYTQNEHEQVRNIAYTVRGLTRGAVALDQRALSDLESDEIAGSFKFGFDALHGAWTVSPYLRVDVAEVSIDGYTERMSSPTSLGSGVALQIDDQSFTSVMSAIGARFGHLSTHGWGTWYPQLVAEYVHEFDNEGEPVSGRYVDAPTASFAMALDDPDQNFANLGVSSSFIFNGGNAAFVNFQTLLGYRDLTTHAVEVGVRVPF